MKMTVDEWAKDFESFVNELQMPRDDYKGIIEYIDDAIALLKKHEWNVLTEDADGVIHGLPGDDGRYIMTDGKDIWIDDYVTAWKTESFSTAGKISEK